MYEVFEHTADLGLRVRAATVEQLFVDAALGMTSLIVTDVASIRSVHERVIEVAGSDLDYLIFDWLSELLVLFETERILFGRFDVRRTAAGISVRCGGEPLDESRHQFEHEVKAITYHGLKVEQTGGEWLAEIIVDI